METVIIRAVAVRNLFKDEKRTDGKLVMESVREIIETMFWICRISKLTFFFQIKNNIIIFVFPIQSHYLNHPPSLTWLVYNCIPYKVSLCVSDSRFINQKATRKDTSTRSVFCIGWVWPKMESWYRRTWGFWSLSSAIPAWGARVT